MLASLTPLGLILFFKGIAIGIAIAAPVGPVAILCIRRTLQYGRPSGFASGMGAVTADMIYGAIASFGVAAVADVLLAYETTLRLVGGVFLLFVGARTWFKTDDREKNSSAERLFPAFASSFLLTITNPLTIFAFTAIFAGTGVASKGMDLSSTWALIAGVALGTVAWWGGLTLVSSLFRERIGATGFVWLHHFSGGLLLVFGIAALGSILVV